MIASLVSYFKEEHGLNFTPAGKVHLDDNGKKAGDLKRYDNMSWNDKPNDNMARTKLPRGIVVLDIDNAITTIDQDNNTISIPALGVTLPLGLYSQTTRKGAYHIYYHTEGDVVRTIKLLNQDIDILTENSVVFEAHTFSENYQLHEGEILELPEELAVLIDSAPMSSARPQAAHLALSSNVPRLNLVNSYLNESLKRRTEINQFFRSIIPKEYQKNPKTGKRINTFKWELFTLNYDFINKIAVKLTTTKELDFHEHVVPTLYRVLAEFGRDPMSSKSQQILFHQILPSLPQHAAITDYKIDDDNRTFQELIEDQPDTVMPVFKTIDNGKLKYLHINRHSLEPIAQNNAVLFDSVSARSLHPERAYFGEDGKKYWDDNVPIVEIISDPYSTSYSVDRHSRHVVNLSQPTEFIKQKEPAETTEQNLLLRLFNSVIHPDYRELVMRYYGVVFFGESSPTTVLWLATRASVKGGTGKSLITVTIPGAILKQQAVTINEKVLNSGYDISEGIRVLSIEEGNTTGKEHDLTYQTTKQLTSPTYSRTNKKYGAMGSQIVRLAITGSSNQLPRLSPTDRRYICLEPAHVAGDTEKLPLNDELTLARFEKNLGQGFEETIQDFVNHVYYHHLQPLSDEINRGLYSVAPETRYRAHWVTGGMGNVKGILHTLPNPQDFMDSIHMDRAAPLHFLLEHLLSMYNPDVGKVALSWQWFADVVPMIASDPDIDLSKKALSSALGDVEFKAASSWFLKRHKEIGSEYSQSFYTLNISEEAISEYRGELMKLHSIS